MRFFRNTSSSRSNCRRERKLKIEKLEDKRLLAITWANEFDTGANDPEFDLFNSDEVIAREIVNRAIDNWERVITDFDYDGDGNPNTTNALDDTYTLNISAGAINGRGQTGNISFGANNKPFSADITLDDNGGGAGWFFDRTPLDDAEFAGIANSFQATFVDSSAEGQSSVNDFYRTILHEIGHAVGIAGGGALDDPANGFLSIAGGP